MGRNSFSVYPDFDLEFLKQEVGLRFPFYDIRADENSAVFFCRIDEETLEENFDSLRRSISDRGYIPMLRYQGGEHVIYVTRRPDRKEKPVWVNVLLLIATIMTTALTGSLLYMEYFDIWSVPNVLEVFSLENMFNGFILFAFPLLSILFVHEMGHYFVSKKHGINTSLPFFIPIPPILPGFNIGTFGALISSRDPMPDKKALFDVGVAGPLAGFLVAFPVTLIGIMNSTPIPAGGEPTAGEIVLGGSILFTFLSSFILNVPMGTPINLSLIAFAGWIGLLITSINLLPAGQLDGGHIFRAVLGEKQRYAGWIAVFIMIFTGWWFFALIIVFMLGMNHPPPLNDVTGIDIKRKFTFLIAVIILILCYIPFPVSSYPV
ncbi:peptidase M50 [Euryarchaeota archaeon ex4484_162]|nr:MAG: peptidase M50 [Euryarchaeota archaeon ex4484_162]